MSAEVFRGKQARAHGLAGPRTVLIPLVFAAIAVCIFAVAAGSPPHAEPVAAEERGRLDVASDGWLSRARQQIRSSEYHVRWQQPRAGAGGLPEGWQAPNRAHDFRTCFTERGPLVTARTPGRQSWMWHPTLGEYGRGVRAVPVEDASLSVDRNRVSYHRPGITEIYVNDSEGLRQTFVVERPPEERLAVRSNARRASERQTTAVGPIYLVLEVNGALSPRLSADRRSADFLQPGGRTAVRLAGLEAHDATGMSLRATFEGFSGAEARGIQILIDDGDAVYPLSVTALAQSPSWTAESDQAGAELGAGVATAGDVNGDGFSDVILGARLYDNGATDEGRVFVWYGASSGFEANGTSDNADWSVDGDQAFALFGSSVATAGDVNGDGYSDVIIGAPQFTSHAADTFEGAAWVFYGSENGLDPDAVSRLDADWNVEANQTGAHLGISVAPAGDVNGDGFSDLIVGAYQYLNDEGRAFVFHGSPAGPGGGPEASPDDADWSARPEQPGAELGTSVATAGDVNGDGYSDVIVGAPRYTNGEPGEGRAFVWHGSATGLGPDGTPANADWSAEGDSPGAGFGHSVSTAGDVDGDGRAEVVVGAPWYDTGTLFAGSVFVYHGASAGLSDSANWIARDEQNNSEFGFSVFTAGDVNGDGYADVVIGAPSYMDTEIEEGKAFVYLGSEAGLPGGMSASPADASWSEAGGQAYARFGHAVATAGDVEGDGYSEILVGAPRHGDPEANEGVAYVFAGSGAGLEATSVWTAEGDVADLRYGYSVAGAGDVNGDGYADVVVSALKWDNGEYDEGRVDVYLGSAAGLASSPAWCAEGNQVGARFGRSVSGAGDVNGDGYADLIIGALNYDSDPTVADEDEGWAFVYHGSPGFSGPGGFCLRPDHADWAVQSDQAGAQFGNTVAAAGDVDGDGYGDVIIGSHLYEDDAENSDEGWVFVFHGSIDGLAGGPEATPADAAWSADGTRPGARLGWSVAPAGDVNRDGYSDVILGAIFYSNGHANEGAAFVYLGTRHGLSWGGAGVTTADADWTVEGNRGETRLGSAVASAGDVNGDGFADVIVGADYLNATGTNNGGVFVYHGSQEGLSGGPEATRGDSDWSFKGSQDWEVMGRQVASAGDVNGDGFSDVIVPAPHHDGAAPDDGRVYVFHGSVTGLSSSPDWHVDGGQDTARIGAVAGAGDVNGDGYAEILIGSQLFDAGEVEEGKVFLYYGNSGRGRNLRPRQLKSGAATPIVPACASDSRRTFRLALRALSPYGRVPLRLEAEVKHLGLPLDGTDTWLGEWTDGGVSGTDLSLRIQPPYVAGIYHWRMRVVYHPASSPFQQRSRWITVPSNSWAEADLRLRSLDPIYAPPCELQAAFPGNGLTLAPTCRD